MKKNKNRPTHKECRQCGEWYSLSKRAKPTQRFCSTGCAAAHRAADPKWRRGQSLRMKAIANPEVLRERAAALWRNPETRALLTEKTRQRSNTPEHRARMKEHNKKLWANKEFRERQLELKKERMAKLWKDPNFREKASAATAELNKKRWADPEFKRRTRFRIRIALAQPLSKRRRSAISKERANRPENRERSRKEMERRWQDPAYRELITETSRKTALKGWSGPRSDARKAQLAKLKARSQSPEWRARMRAFNKQRSADPEYIAELKARWTPERKAKQIEENKRRWSDPKFKARVSKSISAAKRRKAKSMSTRDLIT